MLSLIPFLIINLQSFVGKKSKVMGVCILAILVSSIAFYVLLTMTTTTTTSTSTAKSATTSMTTTSTATATTTSTTTNSCKKSTLKE